MNSRNYILTFVLVLAGSLAARAEVKVTVGHNDNDNALEGFGFKNIPSPSRSNAARSAKFIIVDGELDPASGGLDRLNDGALPKEEDQPAENFFFNAGTPGG